ncbi:element excision factor XisH family protein [Anaerolineales bacterium HSG24]|nr:element excision factor XisH family protein [Anaerolineales bacterium HSG24]
MSGNKQQRRIRKTINCQQKIYHDNMKNALIKDDWIVTHEQMHLKWGAKDMYVDLGAEKFMAAEKNGQKIGGR